MLSFKVIKKAVISSTAQGKCTDTKRQFQTIHDIFFNYFFYLPKCLYICVMEKKRNTIQIQDDEQYYRGLCADIADYIEKHNPYNFDVDKRRRFKNNLKTGEAAKLAIIKFHEAITKNKNNESGQRLPKDNGTSKA